MDGNQKRVTPPYLEVLMHKYFQQEQQSYPTRMLGCGALNKLLVGEIRFLFATPIFVCMCLRVCFFHLCQDVFTTMEDEDMK